MNESRATRFQRERRRTQTAGVIGGAIVLGVLSFTGAGASLAAWAQWFVVTGSGWIAAPAALVDASAEPPESQGYQETEHVRAYYAKARI